jgi:hypothetical protein
MPRKPNRVRYLAAFCVGGIVLLSIVAWFAFPYFSFAEQFRRSKPALNAYAARVAAPGSSALAKPPARLGYFSVEKVEPLPHGFLFESDFGGMFDWNGIAYSTEPLPRYDEDAAGKVKQVFTPIEGNWYEVFRP